MAFSKELIDKIRKAFRDQIDAERAIDKLPPLTDPQFNWWVDQLKREIGTPATSMPVADHEWYSPHLSGVTRCRTCGVLKSAKASGWPCGTELDSNPPDVLGTT